MRLWPDTLAGRTLVLLGGLGLLLIIGSGLLVYDERSQRFDERNRFHLLDRVATLAQLLRDADDTERLRIIRRFSKRGDKVEVSAQPWVESMPRHPMERGLSRGLRQALNLSDPSAVRVRVERANRGGESDQGWSLRKRDRPPKAITLAIRLWDSGWLNIHTGRFQGAPPWARETLQLMLLLLVLVAVGGLIFARRMARPMARLAEAADRFGLGQEQLPLPETGPREVRNTIRAFNRMQARLHKHIKDRSRMLAAVSHDLRTPITSLRLRAEFIEDDEMRQKTLATLEEMESILSATLGFARDEAADEVTRSTDLAALLASLVDDYRDLGGNIEYTGPDKQVFRCRPVALKRALSNLLDNGLKYGGSVRISLTVGDGGAEIILDDRGPGIPEEKLEEVFTPFYRLEVSRSRETGGTGLGLAVARTIVHAHGGQLELSNRAGGGLRVRLYLPSQ